MPYIALDRTLAQPAPALAIGSPETSVGETLLSMQTELDLMLGSRDDVPTDRLTRWINQAYLDIATSLQLEDMEASFSLVTLAGQPMYLLPYQVATTLGVAVIDNSLPRGGAPLDKSDVNEYRQLEVMSGRPKIYFKQDDLLVLYPTPDKAYTLSIDFRARPLPLSLPTHSPALPQEWHEAILLNARQKAFSALLEFDKSQAANNDFIGNVRRRTDRDAEEDTNRVPRSSVPGRAMRYRRTYTPEPE